MAEHASTSKDRHAVTVSVGEDEAVLVASKDKLREVADSLHELASIDEGEHTDFEGLLDLSRMVGAAIGYDPTDPRQWGETESVKG